MRRAMAGVTRAYQCAPTAPNGLHFNAVFTAAAQEANLEHVVILGQWLTAVDHPSLFTREVYIADRLARIPTGMTTTFVNPGWFADNYLMVLDMAAHLGLFTMPLGPVTKNGTRRHRTKTSPASPPPPSPTLKPTRAGPTAPRGQSFCPPMISPPPWPAFLAAGCGTWTSPNG